MSEDSAPIRLKKQLSLHNGVGIIVGIIVGSGIFVSPKGVIMESGSVGACILVWGFCGVICAAGALCYAELGTCIPSSGGDYIYTYESLGDLPAFLYLWTALLVVSPAGNAISALTFASYILQPVFPECGPPENVISLVAALCICLLTFINCRKIKLAIQVQDLFTCTKVMALVIIIIVGIVKIAMGHTENFDQPFKGTTKDPGKMSLAFYSGIYSYSGWNCLNFVTEELKDAKKDLPRAISISLPLVTIIYILTNVAYLVVLTPGEMIASDAVAVTFADRTLGVMSWCMPVFVALSTFGSLNGSIFTSSRLVFVGARQGHLPGFLASINLDYMTPLPSLLFGSPEGLVKCTLPRILELGKYKTLASLIWLCSGDVISLINYTTFVETIFKALIIIGLLTLRVTRPKMKRLIKVNLIFPIFYLIVCIFLIVTPLTSSPSECVIGLILTASGIPVYILMVKWRWKPTCFNVILESCSNVVQKLFTAVPEDTNTD